MRKRESPAPKVFLSIRTQLVLTNILVLALLLGALGAMVRFAVGTTMRASLDNDLVARSQEFASLGPPAGRLLLSPMNAVPLGSPGDQPPNKSAGQARNLPQNARSANSNNDDLPVVFGSGPPGDRGPDQSQLPWDVPNYLLDANAMSPHRPYRFNLDGVSVDTRTPFAPWSQTAFMASKHGRMVLTDIVIHGEPYRLLSRPTPTTGLPLGVMQDVYPLSYIDNAMKSLDRVLLMLSPLAVVCAGLAGFFLTGRVLGRVRHMTNAAAEISEKDFSMRIPVMGHDEFSEMAGTFNGLLQRLEGALNRQVEVNEQQRRFTADASHELKSPLTIILGNAGIALKSPECTGEVRETMLEIDQAADSMSKLVRDLLLLAKGDDGWLGRGPSSQPAREIIERAISRMKERRSAPILVSVEDETLSIFANNDEIVRLFTNLLNNAAEHTPAEGSIYVTASRNGDRAVVIVRDTGSGISPEHLPHLGERFYRLDKARSRNDGGSGLGLSICKSIALANKGEITFESTLGAGVTVTVSLPMSETL